VILNWGGYEHLVTIREFGVFTKVALALPKTQTSMAKIG